MDDDRPHWDPAFGATLLGAVVLVGITHEGAEGVTHEQCFGIVDRADANGVELILDGARAGDRFSLPPDPRAFHPASPGSYRLRSTGDVCENPDFLATWTMVSE